MGRPKANADDAIAVMRAADLDPQVPYPGAKKPWPSRCTRCGDTAAPHLTNVRKGYRGCKTCFRINKMLDPDECAAIMRNAGLEPLVPYPGVKEPWLSRCLGCGRITSPTLKNAQSDGRYGCGTCGHARGGASRRLAHDAATADMRAAGFEPLEGYPGDTMKPWRARCLGCNNEVTPSHNQVSQGRGGCGCGLRTSEIKKQPARSRRRTPAEARQIMGDAGLTPVVDYPGRADRPWPSVCDECKGHVSPRLSTIIAGREGCRPCSLTRSGLLRRIPGANAEAVMLAAGLSPLVPYPGSQNPWLCRCQGCDSMVRPSLAKIRGGQRGCRACFAARLSAQFREDDVSAVQSMLNACLTPLAPYPGRRGSPWMSRCDSCERIVYPSLSNIRAGQGGCHDCAWALNRPGTSAGVYLISHPALNAIKVGIGVAVNGRMSRLRKHTSRGWIPHTLLLDLPSAAVARTIERTVLQHWRTQGLGFGVTRADMPQFGHTETAPLDLAGLAESAAVLVQAHRDALLNLETAEAA